MSLVLAATFLLAQASQLISSSAQQAVNAADQEASACVTTRAKLWSALPDDASTIADATLYVCRRTINELIEKNRALALEGRMSRNESLSGMDSAFAEYKRDLFRDYRNGIIAVIVQERFMRLKPETK